MRLGNSLRRRRRESGGRSSGGSDAGRSASGGGSDGAGGEAFATWGRRLGIALGVVLAGWGIGWLVGTQVLFPAPPPPGDLYEVPDLRGLDRTAAADRLDRVGLSLGTIGGFRHPEADSGTVVGQRPLPGQLATPNAPVEVTVSLGRETRPVPAVAGMRGEWARSVLEASGFRVSVDSVESERPKGRVVELEPEEGTPVGLPAEVRMAVSLGPPRVPMPRLLGLSEPAARDTLTALGLVVGEVDEVFRFGRDQGLVVEQMPPADSLVERGAAVRLTVGRRGNNVPPTP